MTLGLTLLVLAAPSSPHLLPTDLAIVPPHAAAVSFGDVDVGGRISAIRNIVSGSVLLAVSAIFLVPGIYLLVRAPREANPVVFIAVGWALTGMGILLDLVGVPLLVAGIVRNAMYQGASSD